MTNEVDEVELDDAPALRDLIEQLRQIERRRVDATPGSSEYIELIGFERTLVELIRSRVLDLDSGPHWKGSSTGPDR